MIRFLTLRNAEIPRTRQNQRILISDIPECQKSNQMQLYLLVLFSLSRRVESATRRADFREQNAGRVLGFTLFGLAWMHAVHWAIAWGNTLGLLPVMGQPMTWMSAGNSHLLGFALLSLFIALVTSWVLPELEEILRLIDEHLGRRALVGVGGHRLETLVYGQGNPPVVFDAGFIGGMETWRPIQDAVARVTRTVSYERAGLGESETGGTQSGGGR